MMGSIGADQFDGVDGGDDRWVQFRIPFLLVVMDDVDEGGLSLSHCVQTGILCAAVDAIEWRYEFGRGSMPRLTEMRLRLIWKEAQNVARECTGDIRQTGDHLSQIVQGDEPRWGFRLPLDYLFVRKWIVDLRIPGQELRRTEEGSCVGSMV